MDWTTTLAQDKTAWPKGEDQHYVKSVSATVHAVEEVIANVAATDFPLLIMGESGSGKEAVALRIHRRSLRCHDPFVKVVCGALNPTFFETLRNSAEAGNGQGLSARLGTLFLDEIVELTPPSQASLLQAFPDGEVIVESRPLNARIISATSRTSEELEHALERGGLRKDLFYRLNGVCLRLPPLRERKEDIPAFVEFFLRKNSLALGRPQPAVSPRALQTMQFYAWPGNIRELENVVRRMVAVGSDSPVAELEPAPNGERGSQGNGERLSLKQTAREASRLAEKELILKVLSRTHWNRKRAAQQLQISYKALLYKLRQMGLDGSETL